MPAAQVDYAQVSFSVPDRAATRTLIDSVSLTLAAGTVTALLGRSGSGKTTLLRMANGLVVPTAGEVRVEGRATPAWPIRDLRRRAGYVIQETGLFPHWTVARNAGIALELAGIPAAERTRRVHEALALAGLDPALSTRYPWQLSGGQRQRAGVARALAPDPDLLLLDEPFGALDPITRAEMQDMLRAILARQPRTVLLVTHDLDEALYLASRVVFLDQGRITADLPANEVRTSTLPAVQAYVAATHRVPA